MRSNSQREKVNGDAQKSQRSQSTSVKSQRLKVNGRSPDDVAVNSGQWSLMWRADVALGLTWCHG
jgi:hypothetical protein